MIACAHACRRRQVDGTLQQNQTMQIILSLGVLVCGTILVAAR